MGHSPLSGFVEFIFPENTQMLKYDLLTLSQEIVKTHGFARENERLGGGIEIS
jgi:hypothetical protein